MSPLTKPRSQALQLEWNEHKRVFGVADSPVTVGRLKSCDVTMTAPLVSRKHLLLIWDEGKWRATDISANGIFSEDGIFNDQRLPESWIVGSQIDVKLGGIEGPGLSLAVSDADDASENDHSRSAVVEQALAQSTVTQPVEDIQERSELSALSVSTKADDSNDVAESQADRPEVDDGGSKNRNRSIFADTPLFGNDGHGEDEIDLRDPKENRGPASDLSVLEPQVTGQFELPRGPLVRSKFKTAGVVLGSAFAAFVVWSLITLLV